jgi:transcriptional regulator with XRE-family HTH domain
MYRDFRLVMVKITKVQTRQFRELVQALRHYRLEQDFTYRELARRIGIGHSRLFTVMNDQTPRVNDRTLYQLESFAVRVGLLREKVSA